MIYFTLLVPILILSFMQFDKLVQLEYNDYKEKWIEDHRPRGFFWEPSEPSSSFAMKTLSMKWIFVSPSWVKESLDAKKYLRNLRIFVLIWNVGCIMFAYVIFSLG